MRMVSFAGMLKGGLKMDNTEKLLRALINELGYEVEKIETPNNNLGIINELNPADIDYKLTKKPEISKEFQNLLDDAQKESEIITFGATRPQKMGVRQPYMIVEPMTHMDFGESIL